mmetsp:Transcript_31580/g.72070  ORF Transcript_31580/g.72070 Transcript_31580/m.72070 type:complete len:221 (+) Transcript_31580:89-751(+)
MIFSPCCCTQADQDDTSITVTDTGVKHRVQPLDLPSMCIADEGHGYVEVQSEEVGSTVTPHKDDDEDPIKMVEAASLKSTREPEQTPEVLAVEANTKEPPLASPGQSRSDDNEQEKTLLPGPEAFTLSLEPKPGETMGADLTHGIDEDSGLVRIRSIKPDGLFAKWNKNHPDELIQADLYIALLNRKPIELIDNSEMIRQFRAEKVEITFMRKKPCVGKN